MPGASTVTTTGVSEVITRVRSISRRAEQPGVSLWNSIGSYLRGEYSKQFSTQGAYFGKPWKPLKPKYAAWKVTHGYGRRGVLILKGDLRDSFTKKLDAVQRVEGPKVAVFGSNSVLAIYHQKGTHRHKTGRQILPPRQIVVSTPKMRKDIGDITIKYVAGNNQVPS